MADRFRSAKADLDGCVETQNKKKKVNHARN